VGGEGERASERARRVLTGRRGENVMVGSRAASACSHGLQIVDMGGYVHAQNGMGMARRRRRRNIVIVDFVDLVHRLHPLSIQTRSTGRLDRHRRALCYARVNFYPCSARVKYELRLSRAQTRLNLLWRHPRVCREQGQCERCPTASRQAARPLLDGTAISCRVPPRPCRRRARVTRPPERQGTGGLPARGYPRVRKATIRF
jgi:hypothetical protein